MKHVKLAKNRSSFKVLMESPSAQAARTVLKPGESMGEPGQRTPQMRAMALGRLRPGARPGRPQAPFDNDWFAGRH